MSDDELDVTKNTEVTTEAKSNKIVLPQMPTRRNSQFAEGSWPRKFALQLICAAALTGLLIGSGSILIRDSLTGNQVTTAGATLGQVALTESQLRDQVIAHKLTAYWAGSQENALYTLTANANGQVFVRYLPNGKGLTDTTAKYRVIATYPQSDAYSVTQSAGNQANAISFVNADGAQIYYSKTFTSNVYMAYADSPYEIEIFDPQSGGSLSLASTAGTIAKIK